MICRGSDLGEAVSTAHQLEVLCRQYILACQLGEPTLLSDQEWDSFFQQMRATGYGHMREDT